MRTKIVCLLSALMLFFVQTGLYQLAVATDPPAGTEEKDTQKAPASMVADRDLAELSWSIAGILVKSAADRQKLREADKALTDLLVANNQLFAEVEGFSGDSNEKLSRIAGISKRCRELLGQTPQESVERIWQLESRLTELLRQKVGTSQQSSQSVDQELAAAISLLDSIDVALREHYSARLAVAAALIGGLRELADLAPSGFDKKAAATLATQGEACLKQISTALSGLQTARDEADASFRGFGKKQLEAIEYNVKLLRAVIPAILSHAKELNEAGDANSRGHARVLMEVKTALEKRLAQAEAFVDLTSGKVPAGNTGFLAIPRIPPGTCPELFEVATQQRAVANKLINLTRSRVPMFQKLYDELRRRLDTEPGEKDTQEPKHDEETLQGAAALVWQSAHLVGSLANRFAQVAGQIAAQENERGAAADALLYDQLGVLEENLYAAMQALVDALQFADLLTNEAAPPLPEQPPAVSGITELLQTIGASLEKDKPLLQEFTAIAQRVVELATAGHESAVKSLTVRMKAVDSSAEGQGKKYIPFVKQIVRTLSARQEFIRSALELARRFAQETKGFASSDGPSWTVVSPMLTGIPSIIEETARLPVVSDELVPLLFEESSSEADRIVALLQIADILGLPMSFFFNEQDIAIGIGELEGMVMIEGLGDPERCSLASRPRTEREWLWAQNDLVVQRFYIRRESWLGDRIRDAGVAVGQVTVTAPTGNPEGGTAAVMVANTVGRAIDWLEGKWAEVVAFLDGRDTAARIVGYSTLLNPVLFPVYSAILAHGGPQAVDAVALFIGRVLLKMGSNILKDPVKIFHYAMSLALLLTGVGTKLGMISLVLALGSDLLKAISEVLVEDYGFSKEQVEGARTVADLVGYISLVIGVVDKLLPKPPTPLPPKLPPVPPKLPKLPPGAIIGVPGGWQQPIVPGRPPEREIPGTRPPGWGPGDAGGQTGGGDASSGVDAERPSGRD